tara:strand:+ start:97845 stop:99533 length:1689 start_codon:yes stop_codon:yes gene_type:complete
MHTLYAQKEEALKEQSLDDVEALSSKDFPYIEKFHNAVREKLSGNLDEAKSLFESCLKEKDNDDAVHFGLAEIAKEQKRFKSAQHHFERAYQLDKSNIVYLQELAYITYEQGRFEESAKYYEKLVEDQPRNVDWIYGYSQVLIYNRQYEAAANMLEKLQDQVGIVPEIMMMKSDLYQEVDQLDKAENTLLDFYNEYPSNKKALNALLDFYEKYEMQDKAKSMVQRVAQSQPDNMLIQMELATIYANAGEQEKLMNTIRPIIKSDEVEMTDKIYQIEQLLSKFQVEKTVLLSLTEELVKSDENDPGASLLHAEVLTQNSKSKEALPFYRRALEQSGDQYEIWTTVLGFESMYKDYEALYDDGQKALTLFPNMPFIYYAAAEGAVYTGQPEEALDILAAGEIYLIDNIEQKARFEKMKAEAYFKMKEFKKGIKHFEVALSINPEAQIRLKYASCLAAAQIAESIAEEQLSEIEESNKNVTYYLAKSQLEINNKDFSAAEKTIRTGINKGAYQAELYDRLGDVLFYQDEKDKAIESWNKASDLGSRNKSIDQKIKEVKLYAPKYY